MDFYLFFVGRLLRISHEMQFLQVVRAARKTQKLKLGTVDPCVMRANWSGRKCAMFYRSRRGGLDTGNNMSKKFLDLVTLGTLGCSGFEIIFSALVYVMLLNGIFSKMPCPTFCLCEIGFSCWETLRNMVGHTC